MSVKLLRRGSARCVGLLSAFVTILLCLYYISMGQPTLPNKEAQLNMMGSSSVNVNSNSDAGIDSSAYLNANSLNQGSQINHHNGNKNSASAHKLKSSLNHSEGEEGNHHTTEPGLKWGNKCYNLDLSETNVTANEQFRKFDFQPEWIRTKEYWDRGFEERFHNQLLDKQRPPLKVIIVPHSHNDPGWLKTFVNYFQADSRQILNLIVTKMQEYKDMTFIWSEISFLQLWWDQAHPVKQRALKKLIKSGRLEITTGGWVMTDEANVHLYAMLDQLIEGHQWLKNNLNVTPSVGWSIDPFGHGSTVPYLLSASNFEGAIIQRIHYAWKQWFARQQNSDFIWKPYWHLHNSKPSSRGNLLTHNMPFDIYSIKSSCGPQPFVCLNYDFRKIPGEYTEYSIKAEFITDENVETKALVLLDQYGKTGSLFPHNVALIPVGDDFRYNKEREVDQQYTNYKKLIDHIMNNKKKYNVDIGFGTPRDYFNEIRKRTKQFPTFKGDFFVYSDIFSEGHPAYWSGYYTTRPFYKILSSDLEHNLRATEILFTIAYNQAQKYHQENAIKIFEKNYEKMIHARRNLGLFQHHDAITGTSKAAVMRDYGMRLFESLQNVVKMQESTIEFLIQNGTLHHNFLLNELERENFSKLPRKTPIPLGAGSSSSENSIDNDLLLKTKEVSFVVYNSLAQKRHEIVTIRTLTPHVKVMDPQGVEIPHIQINPVWNITDPYELGLGMISSTARIRISTKQYEIMFLAELEALSLTTFKVVTDEVNYKRSMATVYCEECADMENPKPEFIVKTKPPGDIQLENNKMRLLFDEKTGFLKIITGKDKNQNLKKPMQCDIKFSAYRSAQFHSGAYLFKTDPESEAETNVLDQYEEIKIIITSGSVASDVTVVYGPFLAHTVRIFNTHSHIDAAIYIENDIDFEPPPKNRETELFMRLNTDIDNIETLTIKNIVRDGEDATESSMELPIFYSDQNGFQYHKRIKVPQIGIEGNYYPITCGAFIQDEKVRLTLLTTHAQGAASYEPGQLEVMLDRRTLYDDYRGMGEGILDSRLTRHKFWLMIEDMPSLSVRGKNKYQVPSLFANHMANTLRYPTNVYFMETFDDLASKPFNFKSLTQLLPNGAFPCDTHLLNFRTLSEDQLQLFPSSSALLILHRQGYDCSVGQHLNLTRICSFKGKGGLGDVHFTSLSIESIEATSLTATSSAKERKVLQNLAQITLSPMDLRTFNITFQV